MPATKTYAKSRLGLILKVAITCPDPATDCSRPGTPPLPLCAGLRKPSRVRHLTYTAERKAIGKSVSVGHGNKGLCRGDGAVRR